MARLRAAGLQPGLSPARRTFPQVYQLGGICKLVDLLRSPNQNVQQAAAGALRNLVFRSTANKLETRRQNGIREAVSLLRRTGSAEIQKQLTGGGPAAGAGGGGGQPQVDTQASAGQASRAQRVPWVLGPSVRPRSEVSEERGQCVQAGSVFGEMETRRRPRGVGALA